MALIYTAVAPVTNPPSPILVPASQEDRTRVIVWKPLRDKVYYRAYRIADEPTCVRQRLLHELRTREFELYTLIDDPLGQHNHAGSSRKDSASTRGLLGPNTPGSLPRTAPPRKANESSTIGRIDEHNPQPHRRKVAPWYCIASRHLRRQHGAISAGNSSRPNHRESQISSD